MNQKTLWVICGSLFVAAFLLGFVPQYLKGCRNLDHQLDSARLELRAAREKMQMIELGLIIGHVYLETNLKNYGLASLNSTKFFEGVRVMAGQTSTVCRRSVTPAAIQMFVPAGSAIIGPRAPG